MGAKLTFVALAHTGELSVQFVIVISALPVTQGTLKVVGAFHGLSRTRSDARRYPAIDPLDSWTKYSSVVDDGRVEAARRALREGAEIGQMMKVVGEEGTSIEDFLLFLKSGR